MAWDGYGKFIERLDQCGELISVQEPVATELEITAIAEYEMKKPGGGKALLFQKPTVGGRLAQMPVAVNTLGSWRRLALALDRQSIEEVVEDFSKLVKVRPPVSFSEVLQLLNAALELRHFRVRMVDRAPWKENVVRFNPPHDRISEWPEPLLCFCKSDQMHMDLEQFVSIISPTLLQIPVLRCWPLDGGRFFTFPCVVTKDPVTQERNVGMYRVQVFDEQLLGLHWQLQKTGRRHYDLYRQLGRKMPVAIFLGGDPVYPLVASAPLPDGFDELLFAGYLRGQAVELVRCETVELCVPAEADIVIEGYVDPLEPLRKEGPFGDHTGFYTAPDYYPVMHVTAVGWRSDAIYPATIVGVPPKEDYYMGTFFVRLFLPLIRLTFPEIVDISLPAAGVFHNFVFVSIKKTYPFQAYKVMHGLWGMGQLMFSKYIVVVDEDVNVHDTDEVLFHVGAHTDPERDCLLSRGPADVLDHATVYLGTGGKLGIDATRKLPGERARLPWPPKVRMAESVLRRVAPILSKLEKLAE